MRILIVDDDYLIRLAAKKFLSPYGDCDAAPNGDLAFGLFVKAHEEGHPYRLITMDIDMPGSRGPEAVTRIRDWEKTHQIPKSTTEIWMVSASSQLDHVASFLQTDCRSYLAKPLSAVKVREALLQTQLL